MNTTQHDDPFFDTFADTFIDTLAQQEIQLDDDVEAMTDRMCFAFAFGSVFVFDLVEAMRSTFWPNFGNRRLQYFNLRLKAKFAIYV